ncbi:hypothetical protein TVAG_265840 [Trichomonas vaginalis G3]|uniref:RING-type domain-containing protein n=1 Tax=Trichomonas vaginalis (strain ATCC PRA-98 / G3) TaxID=412133 RepID=A2F2I1_TRIV3|nr:ubiquitin-protein transferase protein [Trichomonas vaginalis G3]EAY00881.1 hypothetical protein TVAG_265840 [Trichomonas vaginalis G3]KAI5489246.1 ubiquitin-protein transferase protein [Trichomonas vaginalis G3]|eukprot:XP_001313810.1 hypothetical protein [Trichomonas vaginalis G3]
MGSVIGIPGQNFAFLGGGEPREVSEVLDEEIANHLKEIGVSTVIPIREEVARDVYSPIGLPSCAFPSIKVDKLSIAFSASESGDMLITNDSYSNNYSFGPGNDQIYTFERPPGEKFDVKFTFSNRDPKFLRVFSFTIKRNSQPILVSDTIYSGDEKLEITKVFCQDQAFDNDNNDQNTCLICFSEPATVISLPCRHCSMCQQCSLKFAAMSTICPVCRQPVTELINVVKNQ